MDAPTSPPPSIPPAFVTLAAHPVRWRILSELAEGGDRRVRELTAVLGEPQSLVSYHLGLLRQTRLVTTRQSSADRRDRYYAADLARCTELVRAAGTALHPGLDLGPAAVGPAPRLSGRVLFLCTANSARSQMAEALLQHRTAGTLAAASAGSHPTRVHPNAIAVMGRLGIDLSGRRAKHFDELRGQRFDCVVTVCDRVREVCPRLPGHPRTVHWSMPDPAEQGDTDEATYPAFERTAAELDARISYLVRLLAHDLTEVSR